MEKRLIIPSSVLVYMLTATIEEYERETYGLLVGRKKEKNEIYEVVLAPTSQRSKKYPSATIVNPEFELIVNKIIAGGGLAVIGDYHSHTDAKKHDPKPWPSMYDIETSEHLAINVILAIKKTASVPDEIVSRLKENGKGWSYSYREITGEDNVVHSPYRLLDIYVKRGNGKNERKLKYPFFNIQIGAYLILKDNEKGKSIENKKVEPLEIIVEKSLVVI